MYGLILLRCSLTWKVLSPMYPIRLSPSPFPSSSFYTSFSSPFRFVLLCYRMNVPSAFIDLVSPHVCRDVISFSYISVSESFRTSFLYSFQALCTISLLRKSARTQPSVSPSLSSLLNPATESVAVGETPGNPFLLVATPSYYSILLT